MMHLMPKAGDIVVMTECTAHGILPWRNCAEPRLSLQLRYKCGLAWAKHTKNYPEPWPATVLARCSAATRAIISADRRALAQLITLATTTAETPPLPAHTAASTDPSRMISNDANFGGGASRNL
jgi:hypothetical protein